MSILRISSSRDKNDGNEIYTGWISPTVAHIHQPESANHPADSFSLVQHRNFITDVYNRPFPLQPSVAFSVAPNDSPSPARLNVDGNSPTSRVFSFSLFPSNSRGSFPKFQSFVRARELRSVSPRISTIGGRIDIRKCPEQTEGELNDKEE